MKHLSTRTQSIARRIVALLFLIFLICLPAPVSAQTGRTYYVAPNGNDQNDGSISSPFLTLRYAGTRVAPGDTVYLRGGTYTYLSDDEGRFKAKGTATQRITLKNYNNESVTFQGRTIQIGAWSATNESEYLTISGFTVNNAARYGFNHFGDHNIVSDITVTGSGEGGVNVGYSHDTEFTNLHVYNNVLNWRNTSASGGWPTALGVFDSSNVRFRNNRVHNNYGEGMDAWKNTDHILFANNIVYDNWSVDMYLDHSSYSTIENNLIYETETTNPGNKHLAHGIALADEDRPDITGCTLSNNIIRNNIIINTKSGINNFNYRDCTGLRNTVIENNTFINQWEHGLRILGASNNGSAIRNNIFYPKAGKILEVTAPNDTLFQNNLWYFPGGNISGNYFYWSGQSPINYTTWSTKPNVTQNAWSDPSVVNKDGCTATSCSADNFKLTLGSTLAIDRGSALSGAARDYFNTPRAQPFDIGAHEFGGSASTPTSTPTGTTCPVLPIGVPSAVMTTTIAESGSHKVWVRMQGTGDLGNAIYMQIDNGCAITVGDLSGMPANSWEWVDYQNGVTSNKITPTLSAGIHTITFIQKESGVKLDRILVTNNMSCVPNGTGDNCLTPSPTPIPPSPTPPPIGDSVTIVAAGDIACKPSDTPTTVCIQEKTANLFMGPNKRVDPQAILPLGDLQYDNSQANEWPSYDNSWGANGESYEAFIKSITYPVPGNHEYYEKINNVYTNAKAYYDYFGRAKASPLDSDPQCSTPGHPGCKGYYSYNLGSWHMIALNSNCDQVGGCGVGSPQYQWLNADLDANIGKSCTLAYWHHPRFTSGNADGHGWNGAVEPMFALLDQKNADVVLAGHTHNYERFAKARSDGTPASDGVRQWVVGTGGRSRYGFATAPAFSEARSDTMGVLKLVLQPTSYSWQFVREPSDHPDDPFTDVGSDSCVGLTVTPTPTPYISGTSTPTRTPTSTPTPTPIQGPTNTPTPTPPNGATEFSLLPIADARVLNTLPTTNYGGNILLRTNYLDPQELSKVYMKFDLSQLMGRQIVSAVLRIRTTTESSSGSTQTQEVRSVDVTNWIEKDANGVSGITYATAPEMGSVIGTFGPNTLSNAYAQATLTSWITQKVAANQTIVSVGIENCADCGDGLNFGSLESTTPPVLIVTTTSQTQVRSYTPEADARVEEANATTNYGRSTTLKSDGSPVEISYLRFNITDLAGKRIQSAKLRLRVTNNSTDSQQIRRLEDEGYIWGEMSINSINRPGRSIVLQTFTAPLANTTIEIDVTAEVTRRIGQRLNLAIDSAGTDGIDFTSRESRLNKPHLVVTYQ